MESGLKRLGSWLNTLKLPDTLHLHARATAWVSQSVRNKLLAMALGPLVGVFPLLVVALGTCLSCADEAGLPAPEGVVQ